MMKGLMFQQEQQQQQPLVEENMSNLTSASGEASASSGNRTEIGTSYPQQHLASPPTQTQPPLKKKRNLPGNPDPDAEVIALSPKTLMTSNRFICEICNKGFQRDQNLQLHRRGHNLPWKLKQRTSKEIKKKVYVCPEATCVHHDPARALGDLTGIKKHFCRKHGEKKWKCDKCSKKYAVQSDWKAHSKTCGTREYRCDCGTLFSRRDSFITHRAFCDALAEESARAVTGIANALQPAGASSASHHQMNILQTQNIHGFPLKKEQQSFNLRAEIPPWLAPPPPTVDPIFSPRLDQDLSLIENPNPNPRLGPTLPAFQQTPSPHMSATALLQKAAQMGATMSTKTCSSPPPMIRTHQQAHVHADYGNGNFSSSNFGLNLAPFGNKAADADGAPSDPILHHVINSFSSSSSGFEGTSFEDTFRGILNTNKDNTIAKTTTTRESEALTRDFLGLRPLSHSDILTIADMRNCMNSSHDQQNQSQKPWQG
ncbi:protein indeterminate-domain 11-like [Gastrolobium bilobum]|uniref:protein indeterminate-domain 11-like n=1 Tax=Gastrolobium bilobum TaxID=150636 RepID=UPI002AAF29B0|nr:protein indeterminate-domain 11-like [Gastrolobium bilobum]